MKWSGVAETLLVAIVVWVTSARGDAVRRASANSGGWECVGCTIAVNAVRDIAEHDALSVEAALDKFCNFFPQLLSIPCHMLVDFYGLGLVHLLDLGLEPDEVCLHLNICLNPQCHVFKPSSIVVPPRLRGRSPPPPFLAGEVTRREAQAGDWPDWHPFREWWARVMDSLVNHTVYGDKDKDGFAPLETSLRGTNWRGKDCDDRNAEVYAGSGTFNKDPTVDHNCNGIFGVEPKSLIRYEDLFCSAPYQGRGVVVVGDSVAAHFNVPARYVNSSLMSLKNFDDVIQYVEDEVDWPQASFGTGFWTESREGPVSSVYQALRQRNHCIHRDYQNIAVNSHGSFQVIDDVKHLSRRPTDRPVVLLMSLGADDVCNAVYSLDAMTPVPVFRANMLRLFEHLDTVLPASSVVLIMAPADGGVLVNITSQREHPVGHGVTYSQLYAFLECEGVSPCWQWLNTNASVRTAATQRSLDYLAVERDIVAFQRYKNIELVLPDEFTFASLLDTWRGLGRDPYELVSPVDGFHPSQIANDYLAKQLVQWLSSNRPDILGPENPRNADIERIFHDQGGY